MRRRLGSADVLLIVTVLFWSFNFTAIKYALAHGFAPIVYAAVRFGAGSALFAGITYGRERSLSVGRRELWLLGGVIGLSMYVNQLGFITAVDLTTASTVALLFGTVPIFVALIGSWLGVDRPSRRHWLVAAVSFSGVGLVAAGGEAELSGDLGGILVGLVAPATWALYSVLVTPLLTRYSPYRISTVVGLGASVALLATAAPQLASTDWGAINTLAWAAMAYAVVFALVVTNVLWFTAIERAGPNRAALYANLQPFLGAVFAVLVLSEEIGWLQVLGGVVIGVALVFARERRPPVEVVT